MQDRSHTRDDKRLSLIGALGFPELALAFLYISALVYHDESSTSFALQVLGNLSMIDENRERIASLFGITTLVATMTLFPFASRVQKDAIVAMRHLAYENDGNKQRVLDAGGIAAVVTSMQHVKDNPQVLKQACSALSIFGVHSNIAETAKKAILDSGGLQTITSTLVDHRMDPQVGIAALKALGTLLALPEASAKARESGTGAILDSFGAIPEHAHNKELMDALKQTQRRLGGAPFARMDPPGQKFQ
jgi:Armadillo/beta-catenin-like repeat